MLAALTPPLRDRLVDAGRRVADPDPAGADRRPDGRLGRRGARATTKATGGHRAAGTEATTIDVSAPDVVTYQLTGTESMSHRRDGLRRQSRDCGDTPRRFLGSIALRRLRSEEARS